MNLLKDFFRNFQLTGATPQTPLDFDWVHIPVGKFLYGSEKDTVELSEFYITRVPVTNAQYKVFVDATGHRLPKHWQGGAIPPGQEAHPVVWVSWEDAQAFCAWAGVRLPSEEQWEKAARGTDGRTYPWGEAAPDEQRCNFNGYEGSTTPVGNYPAGASPYGVLDMAGNVWEWTNFRQREALIMRGGSWGDDDVFMRSDYRFLGWVNPVSWDDGIGFRCVRAR